MQITKEGESDQQTDQVVNLTLYRYDVQPFHFNSIFGVKGAILL